MNDFQTSINDGDSEVVTGLGVGNLPNNQNIDVGVGLEVGNSFGVGIKEKGKGLELEQRLDMEIKKQIKKANEDDINPFDEDKDAKFQFRKKGRLTKEEDTELRRIHKTMSDWVKVVPTDIVKPIVRYGQQWHF